MTAVSDLVRDRLSYGLADWMVSSAEISDVISALSSDAALDATIRDLGQDGLTILFQRATGVSALEQVVQILAGRARAARSTARAALVAALSPVIAPRVGVQRHGQLGFPIHGFSVMDYFDLCADLGAAIRRLGLVDRGICGAPGKSHTGPELYSPFSGSGATGINATGLSSWNGFMSRVGAGKNPISQNLLGYWRGLAPAERLGQARQVVCQPISTLFPKVYPGGLPNRAFVMARAGDEHQLEGRLIAAAVLTEARDQSRREDAGEYQAAVMLGRNSSIGLGQVVISTAKRGVLFSDLLTPAQERRLTNRQIAALLASDEFNLFAVSKYIRSVADAAGSTPARNQSAFLKWQPGMKFGVFRRHSRHWPIENVRALGSEYTSRPWDARVVTTETGPKIAGIVAGWGELWGHAYETYGRSGISFR